MTSAHGCDATVCWGALVICISLMTSLSISYLLFIPLNHNHLVCHSHRRRKIKLLTNMVCDSISTILLGDPGMKALLDWIWVCSWFDRAVDAAVCPQRSHYMFLRRAIAGLQVSYCRVWAMIRGSLGSDLAVSLFVNPLFSWRYSTLPGSASCQSTGCAACRRRLASSAKRANNTSQLTHLQP